MAGKAIKKIKLSRKSVEKDAKLIAEPARNAMRNFLKEMLKTQSSRVFVADALGKSVRTINSLIYEGKGGFDLMLAALVIVHGLKEKDIEEFVTTMKSLLRKKNAFLESDRRWSALDAHMSESEKIKWTIVMETYARLS